MEQIYQEGEIVEAHKFVFGARRRWCKATILWLVRTADHKLGEAYMIEFSDGSWGEFDMDHIRPLKTK